MGKAAMTAAAASSGCVWYSVIRTAVDVVLLAFFVVMSIVIPIIDLQLVLSSTKASFPPAMVELRTKFVNEVGNYLIAEKLPFFVGLSWASFFFLWPLSVANSYAILVAGKPRWFRTTCLVSGVFLATSMAAIMGEMVGSEKATKKLYQFYSIVTVFSVVAILKGVVSSAAVSEAIAAGKHHIGRKKKHH